MGWKTEDVILRPPLDDADPLAEGVRIIGIGGTTRRSSGTERVLAHALGGAARAGAETKLLGSEALDLPLYGPGVAEVSARVRRFLSAVRRADGVIVASPGYHGTISGMIKNALDYLEELSDEERPYLEGRGVGCIALAGGPQAAVATLDTLRTVAHALRGWPTPFGAALVASHSLFDGSGEVKDAKAAMQLELVGHQVVEMAAMQRQAQLST